MSDAAAFFANKKKKKSSRGFNANTIDAASVIATVHVYVVEKTIVQYKNAFTLQIVDGF